MNDFAIHLLWCSLQVTLVLAVTGFLYVFLRRRGPAGSFVVLAGLSMVLALSLLLFSPWPHWTSGALQAWLVTPPGSQTSSDNAAFPPTHDRPTTIRVASAPQQIDDGSAAGSIVSAERTAPVLSSMLNEISINPLPRTQPVRNWPRRLVWVFLGVFVTGALGLALGVRSVRRYCRGSRRIVDGDLHELLDVLSARLSCRRSVELRLSSELATPATVGWLRPIVLLPENYGVWTERERTAVLAHELAHIRHHDFVVCCVAQVARVLHFYHPLVHWLVDCLRMEQELAADAAAAPAAGGREIYLRTLAEMALRQTERGIGWPARSFLPTRKTFLRRIEMLRDAQRVQKSPTWGGRVVAALLLLCAAVVAVGLRAPSGPTAQAAGNQQAVGAETTDRVFQFPALPEDTVGVIAVRPDAVLSRPDMQAMVELLKSVDPSQVFGLDLDEIEQIAWIVTPPLAPKQRSVRFGPPVGTLLLRAKTATDFGASVRRLAPDAEEVKFGDGTYYKSEQGSDPSVCYYQPDEQSLALDDEAGIRKLLSAKRGAGSKLLKSKVWQTLRGGFLAVAFESSTVREIIKQTASTVQEANPSGASLPPALASYAPLWEATTSLGLGVSSGENLEAVVVCEADGREKLERVQATLKAQAVLTANMLEQTSRQLSNAPPGAGQVGQQAAAEAARALTAARFETADSLLTMRVQIDPGTFVGRTLAETIKESRAAAHRTVAANNLKQIGLAMHNYYAVNGHLPPAVLTGEDGKTKYSWRIAILPYLDQQKLHDEYRFDQPWDSEANRKVLAKMPAVYRAPTAPKEITNSSYFVFTGGGSAFSGKEGTDFTEVRDGTSNTVLVVEAQRGIPWTKPEDIPYDPEEELPEVGGVFAKGFGVLLGDGSVRFLGTPVNATVFRALITISGGEVIDWDQL